MSHLIVTVGLMTVALSCGAADLLVERSFSGLVSLKRENFRQHFFAVAKKCPALTDCTDPSHATEIDKRIDGETLLHIAARDHSVAPLQLLLEYGASPHYSDRNGNTPLDEILNSKSFTTSELSREKIKLLSQYKAPFALSKALNAYLTAELLCLLVKSYPNCVEVNKEPDTVTNILNRYDMNEDLWRTLFEAGLRVTHGHYRYVPYDLLMHPKGDLLCDLFVRVGNGMNKTVHTYIDTDLKLIADHRAVLDGIRKKREDAEEKERKEQAAAALAARQREEARIKAERALERAQLKHLVFLEFKRAIENHDATLFFDVMNRQAASITHELPQLVVQSPPPVDLGNGIAHLLAYAQLNHPMPAAHKCLSCSCTSRQQRERAATQNWLDAGRTIREALEQLQSTGGVPVMQEHKAAPGGPLES